MPLHVINEVNTDPQVAMYKRKVTLTDADIKAIPETRIELVPALGVNKLTVFHSAVIKKGVWAAGYTGLTDTSDYLYVLYDGLYERMSQLITWDNVNNVLGLKQLLADTPMLTMFLQPSINPSSISIFEPAVSISDSSNKALTLFGDFANGFAHLTGGNAANTIEITTYYSVVDL